jgi:hypothetical protein
MDFECNIERFSVGLDFLTFENICWIDIRTLNEMDHDLIGETYWHWGNAVWAQGQAEA